MTVLLIANNCTRESGSFMGDQLCALRTCYLFVERTPNVEHVIMSMSRGNEMHFLWTKFIEKYDIEVVWDDWNAGDWASRWNAWDKWRAERSIEGRPFDVYKEHYLRIHGAQRQAILCGHERGLGRRNIYEYWYCGQEDCPDGLPESDDWFGDGLIHHPPHRPERDVYISPLCKTQGNYVFTFQFWEDVVRLLVHASLSVTVGHPDPFCDDLLHRGDGLYRRHFGTHEEWMEEVCQHRIVACGNTGTGWLAAACGVPMITMEPHGSVMADHRYRECGLHNIVEVVDGYKLDEMGNDMRAAAVYVAQRLTEECRRRVVLTTGCYDVLHAGHVRHLQRARAMGTKLVVALNSDASVRFLKGPERPINPEGQRRAVLEALRCVDEVCLFDGPNALDLIHLLKPAVLACGYGYTTDTIVGRDVVEGYGGQVAVTCPADARGDALEPEEPSTTAIVRRVRTADVSDVVRAAAPYSVNPPDKLRLLAEQVLSVAHVPGALVDVGTCRGGTGLILRRLAPDRHLYLFDTWQGNPHDDPLCHHRPGEWAAALDDCRAVVGNGELTHYCQGVFPEWYDCAACHLRGGQCSPLEQLVALAYIDADTYQSTRDAISTLWPRLATGGKLVIDDYSWEPCAGVKKAVDELLGTEQVRVVGYTAIVEKR